MNTQSFKSWPLAILLGVLIIAVIGGWFTYQAFRDVADNQSNNSTNPTPTPTATVTSTPSPTPQTDQNPTPTTAPVEQQVKVFYVVLDSTTTPTFGCGDSLQEVTQTVTTATPLQAALSALLSNHNQYYGQSGPYNALHQSRLQIESINLDQGLATIRLTGTLSPGGTCDAPRITQQLTATATQFASVTSVNITVNGTPLEQALSTR